MASDEEAIRAWFDELARCVNATDYAAGRRLFAHDIVSFGTFTPVMQGLDPYAAQQWPNVWPHVRDFRFKDDLHVRVEGGTAWAVCTWDSLGVRPDDSTFPRPGRATMIFEKRRGRWLGVHSHFSLLPKRSLEG